MTRLEELAAVGAPAGATGQELTVGRGAGDRACRRSLTSGFFFLTARALTALLSRLLCRAALFRWVRPLFTMLATSAAPALKAVAASAVSPASMALMTFLMAVRMRERRATLC